MPHAIRLATPADAPRLAQLRYDFRAGQDASTEDAAAFVERCSAWMSLHLAPGGGWRCWVAEVDQRIVGTTWLHLIEKLPNPQTEAERHGYVSNVFVVPELRGRGTGAALLATCIAACREDGCDAVVLWPTRASRSLYARHGFAVRQDLMELRPVR